MRRMGIVCVALLASSAAGESARAQWGYPRGYGGYGMSQWGADPGAGYMAGLGSFARGQGVYQLEKAKADAINVVTMQKWNQALREEQARLRKKKAEEDARREADREARVAAREAVDGTVLNDLLMQIFDSDPGVVRAARVATPLSADAIREIPFEWDSEAISLCLDQMLGQESLPPLLATPRYAAEREALRAAVAPALAEDLKGAVSPESLARVRKAVADFRASFTRQAADVGLDYQAAKDYLTTLDSLSRLLGDPGVKALLKDLEDGKARTVGDLIAFMNAFNLRFGPATSPRQMEIYGHLAPAIAAVRDAAVAARTAEAKGEYDPKALRSAATAAFKGMHWDDLDAHGR